MLRPLLAATVLVLSSCSDCGHAPESTGVSEVQLRADARMLASALPELDRLEQRMRAMDAAYNRKDNLNPLLTEDQDENIALAFQGYLTFRKVLFHILFRHQHYAAAATEEKRDASFLLAYTAGLTLYRNGVILVTTFKDHDLIRPKLNEADARFDIPAGMFDLIYKNITHEKNISLMVEAMAAFEADASRLEQHSILSEPGLEELPARLRRYTTELNAMAEHIPEGRRDLFRASLKKEFVRPIYQAQKLISMMVAHIRVPLHSGGLTPETIRTHLQPLLQPGDILLTRRDGYLSNTFLPGYWGHAALYLGTHEVLSGHASVDAAALRGTDHDGFPFAAIEAIGEGVRFSSLEFALHANHVAVFRPRVPQATKLQAVTRAMRYHGAPYDFSFDFVSKDKLVCTELVYRAYDPMLPIPVDKVMGRLALKPDSLVRTLATEEGLAELVVFGDEKDGDLVTFELDALLAKLKD
jgi:hypothetical protein